MNVSYDEKSKTVTLTFKYDPNAHATYPASSTGKTQVVSSSGGFARIPNTVASVSWNATIPNPDYRKV